MSKEEFLRELRKKLEEEMTPGEIEEQIRYYSGYIDGEKEKGKTEGEITAELGDPVLLARTLLDTRQTKGYTEYTPEEQSVQEERRKVYKRSVDSSGCLIGILIAAVVVCVLLWLVGSIFRILAPVLVPVLLIAIAVSLWKKR